MEYRSMKAEDISACVELACQLWRTAVAEELQKEFLSFVDDEKNIIFLAVHQNKVVAFQHVCLRTDYVEGADSSPVVYLEGIFVLPEYRNHGIAKKLIEMAKTWGKQKGCTQMASDAQLDNTQSQAFHHKVGFTPVNQIICYIKKI